MNKLQEAAENAAQHLEMHPETYKFMSLYVPETDKGTACAAGWFCYYLGYNSGIMSDVLEKEIGMNYSGLQDEWEKLVGFDGFAEMTFDPDKMAWLLRESAMTFLSDQETGTKV